MSQKRGLDMFQPPAKYKPFELQVLKQAIVTCYKRRTDTKDFQTIVEMLGLDDVLLQLRLAEITDI